MGAPEPDSRCGWSESECQKAEAAALEEVEALEERVFSASLQVKVRYKNLKNGVHGQL